jgi:AcrR family transcriptional regulator
MAPPRASRTTRSARSEGTGVPARPGGRPRNEQARTAILEATYQLVREHGYMAVTTADIASRAGVGKQTIYRWWPTKWAVVLEALEEWMRSVTPRKPPTTLSSYLVEICRGATLAAPIFRALIAEAQHDAELHAQLKRKLVEPRRAALRVFLPQLRTADRDLIAGAIYGAILYQLLLGEPLDATFIRSVNRLVARLS